MPRSKCPAAFSSLIRSAPDEQCCSIAADVKLRSAWLTGSQQADVLLCLPRFVKFQAVSHLTIFIADNQGDEETTRVQRIQLLGMPQDTTDVSKIKKAGEDDH